MARKRQQNKRQEKNKNMSNIDLTFMVMVFITILLFIIVYGQSGDLSKLLDPMIGGIFGPVKYILPIGSAIMCLIISQENRKTKMMKIWQYFGIISLLSSLFTVYDLSNGKISKVATLSEILSQAYNFGKANHGGGVIGSLIAAPLVQGLRRIWSNTCYITYDINTNNYSI